MGVWITDSSFIDKNFSWFDEIEIWYVTMIETHEGFSHQV